MSNITMYWVSGAVDCWKPMLCLEEKGLSDYNSKLISLDKKEDESAEFLALSPRGMIPVLVHGDVVMDNYTAICLYLENTFKNQGTKLLPDNPAQQALVLQRMMEVENIEKLRVDQLAHRRLNKPEDWDKAFLLEKCKALAEELQRWEKYMAQNGPYITGKDFTMADVYLFLVLAGCIRMQLRSKDRFPHLMTYYERVKERPSVKKTWPPHWKTTPNPDYMKDV